MPKVRTKVVQTVHRPPFFKLLDYRNIHPKDYTRRCIAKAVSVAKEGDMVALVGEIAFVAGIYGEAAKGHIQACLIPPGHLLEPRLIAFDISKFGC